MSGLRAHLGDIRGRMTEGRPLAPLTWLRVGGKAELFFQPEDRADLATFMAALPPDVPLTPLGVCSNMIIRDGGLPGAAVRLGRPFAGVEVLAGSRLRVGAAMLDAHVGKKAAEAGIAGLEFLRTIPGAIGGAVKMNAGCYGSYTADVIEEVTLIDRAGAVRVLYAGEIEFSYRASSIPDDAVIVEAVLRGQPGETEAIEARMAEALRRRAESQPVDARSCGSTFRNPAGYSSTGAADDPMDLKAWKLIDDAGCRGLRLGGAQISPKHSNFLVNSGGASARDLEMLGEFVRDRVKSTSGHNLIWEIQRLGAMLPE
ncbi:UDP-N-acetylmuramate dehydrogenase [Rhodobacteraceae bacterium NNCM2]|nr:UDP-N-acetylmuramate dehydrogenase [Coraliihabitans acroporae]